MTGALSVDEGLANQLRVLADGQNGPACLLPGLVLDRLPASDIKEFRRHLLERLDRFGYATVEFVDVDQRFIVSSLIADCLGGLTGMVDGPLGGELTEVETRAAFDHNLAWHTDSTSWEVPNRWQVLVLIRPDRWCRLAPTAILPLSRVLPCIPESVQRLLRRHKYPWRQQFPDLVPIEAPILGTVPRWLRPALVEQFETQDMIADAALNKFAEAIKQAQDYIDVELGENRVLVFDNHKVLHRGPHLKPDGGRTVLRLKVGGYVGELAVPT